LITQISIHSPRMGRDGLLPPHCGHYHHHFNPLSPHGERLAAILRDVFDQPFQSTLPAWGETLRRVLHGLALQISIHSPRMGRDIRLWTNAQKPEISIHSPRMGRDSPLTLLGRYVIKFQSTLPAWGETFN